MRKYFKINNSIVGPLYFYQETPIIDYNNKNEYMGKTIRNTKKHVSYQSYYKSDVLYYELFTNLPASISKKSDAFEWSNDELEKNKLVLTFMETTWSTEVGKISSAYPDYYFFDNIFELDYKKFEEEINNLLPHKEKIINNIVNTWTLHNNDYKEKNITFDNERKRQQFIEEGKTK